MGTQRVSSRGYDVIMLSMLALIVVLSANLAFCQRLPTSCVFNTMCACRPGPPARHHYTMYMSSRDDHAPSTHYIDQVVCIGVPFSKLPDLPRGPIAQVDIANAGLTTVESEPLAGTRIESLRLMENNIKHIDERAFSSMSNSLISLDLAYNDLDAIPFAAIQDLRNLQWLNLHGNEIQSVDGNWAHLHDTLTTLLIGDNDLSNLNMKTSDSSDSYNLHKFQSLTTLNVEGNKITHINRHTLPSSIQTLRLSHNLLNEFPIEILEHLHNLQWLYLRGNYLSNFIYNSVAPRHSIKFEKLDFAENNLKSLPKFTTSNHSIHIRDLSLEFNQLDTLQAEAFMGLNCGRILLNYNNIKAIDTKAFVGIENTLEYLDLQNNKLKAVPVAINKLKCLKYLYLGSNMISEIPEDSFESFGHCLRALSLSGNMLNTTPKEALVNCTKLTHLNLGYNHIAEVNEDDFQEWSFYLDTLLLRSNRINTLSEYSFNWTSQLRELSLSFNPINFIHPNTFKYIADSLESIEISFALSEEHFPLNVLKNLHKLLWLALDNNNIRAFHMSTLNYFPLLQYLNLEANKIQFIEPGNQTNTQFESNLTVCRLSQNELRVIESKTFVNFPKLQTIAISLNKIALIKTYSFTNLTGLIELALSNNLISVIEPGSFSNLPVLQKLDLQKNRLVKLSANMFQNSTSSQFPLTLNLSLNQLSEIFSSDGTLYVKTLDLNSNHFKHPPKQFLEKISSSIKNLYMEKNKMMELELEAFGALTSLEVLTLKHNHISRIIKHSFLGLDLLQVLDLSYNNIDHVHVGQFSYLQHLRVINLSWNNLNYLPKECFRNTKLERVDLSNNQFTVIPSNVLSDVGLTLRSLMLNNNNIEHIDGTMFPMTPFLLKLNLSRNRLNFLPDNVFANLDHMQQLDLSSNPLRANFKELFHYAQSLKQLNLANIGLKTMPTLPLPNLTHLNLSSNIIEDINRYSVKTLTNLKHLYLRNNNFTTIPSNHWGYLKSLKTLDIGKNPIKEITTKSFQGLTDLQHLFLDGLNQLEVFESDSLAHLKLLTSLTIQTWIRLKKTKFYLEHILSNLTSLRKLCVDISEDALTDQLHGVLNNRIKELTIRGRHLRAIDLNAFHDLENNAELSLSITETQIEELPTGIFSLFNRIPHLKLDLTNNLLSSLTPDVFYNNMSNWDSLGTKIITGGLLLNKNPWICDCRLVWLGHWLRRWLRETLQIHTMDVDTAHQVWSEFSEAQCRDPDTGTVMSIINLFPEDMSCHASALSNSGAWTHHWHYMIFKFLPIILMFLR